MGSYDEIGYFEISMKFFFKARIHFCKIVGVSGALPSKFKKNVRKLTFSKSSSYTVVLYLFSLMNWAKSFVLIKA